MDNNLDSKVNEKIIKKDVVVKDKKNVVTKENNNFCNINSIIVCVWCYWCVFNC